MSYPEFHLSIDVRDLDAAVAFFTRDLRGTVAHRDPSGYVNVDFYGCQLTLKKNARAPESAPNIHFGVNLTRAQFTELAEHVMATARACVAKAPYVADPGTPIERAKMYLNGPSGYVVELKGY